MTDIKAKLDSDLKTVTDLIDLKDADVIKAKKRYDLSFFFAISVPTLFLLFQLYALRNTLAWDVTNQRLWVSIKDTFSFVIGVFGVLAAITGMFGFNHRAKQLDLQQLRASKQVTMAELQFDLANQQFDASQARENLKLFYDHENIFEKHLKHITAKLEEKHGESVNIYLDSWLLYNSFFPKNSPLSGVINHDPKWPNTIGGWEKESYGSFKGYILQIEKYAKNYPLISDDAADFKYELQALIDIYNTLASIGFNKALADDDFTDQKSQFTYVKNIVFVIDYLLYFNIITNEEKTQALEAMFNLFGGLFWPSQVNINNDE